MNNLQGEGGRRKEEGGKGKGEKGPGDIVNQKSSSSPTVIRPGDRTERLLSSLILEEKSGGEGKQREGKKEKIG